MRIPRLDHDDVDRRREEAEQYGDAPAAAVQYGDHDWPQALRMARHPQHLGPQLDARSGRHTFPGQFTEHSTIQRP